MPKRRSDAFFGMHFDFHAQPNQTGIGEFCDYAAIEELIDAVKPDYVQCDTKGHAGASSYPTKVGYPAPDMKGDILKMWREVTARHDVALFAHHSGVWDNTAAQHHPEWAACDENGEPSKEKMSTYGPYAVEFLAKQLLEMALDYGLDGAWVDGECWAVVPDYSVWATDEYKMRFSAEPPKHDDPDYYNYLKFNRQGFREYVDRYVHEVHKYAPDFQITSNWLYTSFMPEPPEIPVDYISGDYSPNDSVNAARFEGRCIAGQQEPWDLMAWGFSVGGGGSCVKEYEQLCQEAAAVIMLGGGFQVYNHQLVGSVQKWAIPMWAELAKFCRAREELCHKAEFVPQVGIIYSRKAQYHDITPLFANSGRYINEVRGTLMAVLDAGYSAEVLITHQAMAKNLDAYGAIIITDMTIMESDLRSALLDYAEHGGKLIISGYNSAQLFLPYLDIDISGGSEAPVNLYIENGGRIAPLPTPYRDVKLNDSAKPLGYAYLGDDTSAKSIVAASVTHYGEGSIAGIYFNPGRYAKLYSAVIRNFMRDLIGSLFTPSVRLDTPEHVEVALMRKNGQLRVNLLNMTGNHSDSDYKSFDRVTPVYGIGVEIDYPTAPESVTFEPEGIPLDYEYADGVIRLKLERLHIHGVIAVK